AGALLHAHLADAIVDAGRLDDHRAFFQLERERLLDVDVLAGVERVDGDGGVPVVGDTDYGDVDGLGFEELAVIGEGLCGGPSSFRLVDVDAVDVADGGDFGIAGFDEIAGVVAAALAGADQSDLDAVVGSHDPGVGDRGGHGSSTKKHTT